MQFLGRVLPESIHDSFCFLQEVNSLSLRFFCDRGSILHRDLAFPPVGMLLRFEAEHRTDASPRAINVRVE